MNEARGKFGTFYNRNKFKPQYIQEFSEARKNR